QWIDHVGPGHSYGRAIPEIPKESPFPGLGWPGNTSVVTRFAPALKIGATAANQAGDAQENQIQLLGVNDAFEELVGNPIFLRLNPNEVVLNSTLAERLRVTRGDTVIMSARKPAMVGIDFPGTATENSTVLMRLKVRGILSAQEFGNFSLTTNHRASFNA